MSLDAFYYGCWGLSGHVMHTPTSIGFLSRATIRQTLPRRFCDDSVLDTGLAPKGRQVQGRALLHHHEGWTALAFWDRTGDKRGNSNSVFILRGTHDFEAALTLARQHFPELFERFTFQICLAPQDQDAQHT